MLVNNTFRRRSHAATPKDHHGHPKARPGSMNMNAFLGTLGSPIRMSTKPDRNNSPLPKPPVYDLNGDNPAEDSESNDKNHPMVSRLDIVVAKPREMQQPLPLQSASSDAATVTAQMRDELTRALQLQNQQLEAKAQRETAAKEMEDTATLRKNPPRPGATGNLAIDIISPMQSLNSEAVIVNAAHPRELAMALQRQKQQQEARAPRETTVKKTDNTATLRRGSSLAIDIISPMQSMTSDAATVHAHPHPRELAIALQRQKQMQEDQAQQDVAVKKTDNTATLRKGLNIVSPMQSMASDAATVNANTRDERVMALQRQKSQLEAKAQQDVKDKRVENTATPVKDHHSVADSNGSQGVDSAATKAHEILQPSPFQSMSSEASDMNTSACEVLDMTVQRQKEQQEAQDKELAMIATLRRDPRRPAPGGVNHGLDILSTKPRAEEKLPSPLQSVNSKVATVNPHVHKDLALALQRQKLQLQAKARREAAGKNGLETVATIRRDARRPPIGAGIHRGGRRGPMDFPGTPVKPMAQMRRAMALRQKQQQEAKAQREASDKNTENVATIRREQRRPEVGRDGSHENRELIESPGPFVEPIAQMRLDGARRAKIPHFMSAMYSNQQPIELDNKNKRNEPEVQNNARPNNGSPMKNRQASDSDAAQVAAKDTKAPMSKNIKFHELTMGRLIGEGGFGKVHQAKWQGRSVAVKLLICQDLRNDILTEFESEVKIMSRLSHPNICSLLGVCMDPPHRALVVELLERGSLWSVLRRNRRSLDAAKRARFLYDTAKGMSYLHHFERPILHRDLKSPNLLVDKNYNIKISDFGLARVRAHVQTMTGNCGTVQWMAPEVLANQKYTEKADVFSFGIVVWEVMTGECPYDGMTQIQTALGVLNRNLRPEVPPECPQFFVNLMKTCWHRHPEMRPSFRTIVNAIRSYQHNLSSSKNASNGSTGLAITKEPIGAALANRARPRRPL